MIKKKHQAQQIGNIYPSWSKRPLGSLSIRQIYPRLTKSVQVYQIINLQICLLTISESTNFTIVKIRYNHNLDNIVSQIAWNRIHIYIMPNIKIINHITYQQFTTVKISCDCKNKFSSSTRFWKILNSPRSRNSYRVQRLFC